MKLLLLISLIIFINSVDISEKDTIFKIDDFRTSLFKFQSKSEGYYYVDIGLDKTDHIIGYTDFDLDADKQTDIITYRKKDTGIEFYIYNYITKDAKFIKQETPFFILNKTDITVTNVYVGPLVDANNYGFIITVLDTNETYTTYFTDNNGKLFKELNISPIFIGDINGDRKIEIIANNEGRKIYYIKTGTEGYFIEEGSFTDILLNASNINDAGYKYADYKLANYGAALIDVDGDCRNDLLLTSINDGKIYLEIYRGRSDKNTKTIKYVLNEKNSIIELGDSTKIGAFNIGNFDGDGFVDLIIPILNTENKPSVKILFNKNIRSYSWSDVNYCKTHPEYTNEIPVVYNISEAKEQELNLEGYSFEKLSLIQSLTKIADLQNDGYDGFGAVFKNINTNEKRICTFINKYIQHENNIFELDLSFNVTSVNYISFFDLDENGNIDLFVDTNNNGTISIYNNFSPDTYFIKAKTLLNTKKYSTETGTNYRFIATNNDGDRKLHFAWQMAMTTDLSMNTPYALIGIGRSNNYVENFVSISSSYDSGSISGAADTYEISPIIPKTQLLITKENSDNSINWHVDLIVSPTENLLIMMIVIGAILILILIVIIILSVKEKKEDKKQETGTEQFRSWFN